MHVQWAEETLPEEFMIAKPSEEPRLGAGSA